MTTMTHAPGAGVAAPSTTSNETTPKGAES
jgi:hypothetical protein